MKGDGKARERGSKKSVSICLEEIAVNRQQAATKLEGIIPDSTADPLLFLLEKRIVGKRREESSSSSMERKTMERVHAQKGSSFGDAVRLADEIRR